MAQLNIKVSDELKLALKSEAIKAGLSLGDYANQILRRRKHA
jgi:predicted HicB family RNase H-like nuclease